MIKSQKKILMELDTGSKVHRIKLKLFHSKLFDVQNSTYSHDPNKHACTFIFFKDLAPPIWLVRAYTFIKLSKLQNIHIKKHGKKLFNTAIITGFNMILLFLLHFSSKKGFLLNITCQYLNDKSTLYVHLEHFCPICLKIL